MNKIFSKIAVFAVGAAMAVGVGVAASRHVSEVKATDTVSDVVDLAFTGASGTTYSDWSAKTGTSGAVYAGNSAGDKSSVQLRSKSGSGIITTTSGGLVKSVTVVWNADTDSTRVLDIYGKSSAYTATSELYGTAAEKGTKLGSIAKASQTSLTIEGDYEFIGLRSNNGAMYLTSITIEWQGKDPSAPSVTITTEACDFEIGAKGTFTAEKTNADEESILWSSSDPSVISVNETTGEYEALKLGVSNITATLSVSGKTSSVQFGVTKEVSVEEAVELTAALADGATSAYSVTVVGEISELFAGKTGPYGVWLKSSSADKAFEIYFAYAKPSNWDEVAVVGNKVTAKGNLMNYVKSESHTYELVNPTDFKIYTETLPAINPTIDVASLAKGETATITTELLNGAEGVPTYEADNPSLVELAPAANGLTCVVTALTATATTNVTITVSLTGCDDKTVVVEIKKDAVVKGIEIKTLPTKLTYYVGDTIDLTGIEVLKVYEDDSKEPVAIGDLDVAADLSAVAEDVDVTLTLKGTTHEAHFKVNVVEKPAPAGITVAQALELLKEVPTPTEAKATNYVVDAETEHAVTGFLADIGSWNATSKLGSFYLATELGGTTKLQVFCREASKAVFDAAVAAKAGAEVTVTGVLGVYAKENKDSSIERQEEIVTPSSLVVVTPAPEITPIEKTVAEAVALIKTVTPPENNKTTYVSETQTYKVEGFVCDSFDSRKQVTIIGLTGDETVQLKVDGIDETVYGTIKAAGTKISATGLLAWYKNNKGVDAFEVLSPVVEKLADPADPIEVNVAGAHEAAKDVTPVPGSTVKVSGIQQYAVTGYVKNVKENTDSSSGEWKDGWVWIVDDLDTKTAPEVQLFSVKDKTVFDSIKATGTQIKATGLLGVYQQSSETEAKLEVINPAVEKLADPVVTVKSLSYEGTPKTTYEIGDSLDLSGITKIIVTYSDSTEEAPHTKEVALTDCTVSGFDSTNAGNKVVKVAYTEDDVEVSFNIMVKVNAPVPPTPEDPTVVGISVLNEKTEYEVGDTFDLNALTVTLDMSDDSEVAGVLGTNYTIEGPEGFDGTFRAAGTFTFTVVALEDESVTASFTVTVTAPEPPAPTLVSITVTTTVTEYNVGDVIDKSTLTVTATYSDGSTAVIAPEEYTVAFDSSTASEEVPVTVTYQGKTYTFKVKVNALAPAKKGCGGEIVTTSIILSTLSLAGVALLSLKKKKED